MRALVQDIRYTFRTMLKHPGFTLTVLLTMALGIGVNTAIFSVVNMVLLRPLPYRAPDRVMFVWSSLTNSGQDRSTTSLPDFNDWKSQNQVFESLSCYSYNLYNLIGDNNPEQVRGAQTAAGFFQVLGVEPALGRVFSPEEDRDRLVVLSHGLWQQRFGSDPNVVNRQLVMNGETYTIIGVMPPHFQFPSPEIPLWTTFATIYPEATTLVNNRKARNFRVIGRLKEGVSRERAQTEMTTIARRLEQQHPDTNSGVAANVVSLHDQTVGDIRPILLVLLGVVGFVLLIACANVANLLLARSAGREREIALRSAVGATRGRVVRQLLTESVVLSVLGGVIGLLLALWGVNLLIGMGLESLPRIESVTVDWRLLLFGLGVSLLTGLIFGLAPVLQTSRLGLGELLKEGGRGGGGGVRGRRAQSLLIVTEVALTMVLLIGAGLMARSLLRLLDINPGFRPDNILTFQLSLPNARYKEETQRLAFFSALRERLAGQPGVQSVALSQSRPPDFLQSNLDFQIEGQPQPGQARRAAYLPVSDNFFSTLGIPLVKGRFFTTADRDGAPVVVIINETLARRYFQETDPLGKKVKVGSLEGPAPWATVVGVVGDVKYRGLDADAGPSLYYPEQQTAPSSMYVFMRTTTDPQNFISAVRNEVRAADPELPVSRVKSMDQLLQEAVSQPRFVTLLITIFAGVALVLAAVGIYGVIAYSVSQRTQEIGVRMALGATPRAVLGLVVWQGLKLALVGVAVGLAAAFGLTGLITKLLYQVSPADPVTYVIAALILAGFAVAASYLPARRATKVEPIAALRYQ